MTIYVVFGGMLATTWVQIIKAGMLMTAGVIVSVAVLAKFNFNPNTLLDTAASKSDEGKGFLGPGLYIDGPLLVISTGMTIFFGTAGLPHILMRFFTVPDGNAARRSVVWTIGFIGVFTALVTIIGFGARAILGGGDAEEAVGTGGNLAAPLLAQSLGGGEGTTGGDIALALFAAAAFATILAVVAGLVLAAASAVTHDLWTNVLGPRERGDARATTAKIASVVIAVLAILCTLAVGSGFNVSVLVAMAFVFAASANFPALVFALGLAAVQHHRRDDRRGVRRRRLGRDDRAEPAGVAGPGLRGLALAVHLPGADHDADRLPGLLARDGAEQRGAREDHVRRAARALGAGPRLGQVARTTEGRPARGGPPASALLRRGDLVVAAEQLERVDLGLDAPQAGVDLVAVERRRVGGALGEVEVLLARRGGREGVGDDGEAASPARRSGRGSSRTPAAKYRYSPSKRLSAPPA